MEHDCEHKKMNAINSFRNNSSVDWANIFSANKGEDSMETQKNINEPKSNADASKGGGRKQSGGGGKPITSNQGAPQGDAQVHTDRVAESGAQAEGGTEAHGSTYNRKG